MPRTYTMRQRPPAPITDTARATTVWLDPSDIAYLDELASPRNVSRGRIVTELIEDHRKRAARRRGNGKS